MPNHVDHDMWIWGPPKDIDDMLTQHIKSGSPNADSLIPYPPIFRYIDKKEEEWWIENTINNSGHPYALKSGLTFSDAPPNGFNAGGYEWCCENWGTKWGCYDGQPVLEIKMKNPRVRKVFLQFLTAWNPAIPVYAELASRYPKCTFKIAYYESGMGYSGTLTYKYGACIRHIQNANYRGRRGG